MLSFHCSSKNLRNIRPLISFASLLPLYCNVSQVLHVFVHVFLSLYRVTLVLCSMLHRTHFTPLLSTARDRLNSCRCQRILLFPPRQGNANSMCLRRTTTVRYGSCRASDNCPRKVVSCRFLANKFASIRFPWRTQWRPRVSCRLLATCPFSHCPIIAIIPCLPSLLPFLSVVAIVDYCTAIIIVCRSLLYLYSATIRSAFRLLFLTLFSSSTVLYCRFCYRNCCAIVTIIILMFTSCFFR